MGAVVRLVPPLRRRDHRRADGAADAVRSTAARARAVHVARGRPADVGGGRDARRSGDAEALVAAFNEGLQLATLHRVRRRGEQPRQSVPAAARDALGALRARCGRDRRAVVRAADGRRAPPASATRAACGAARIAGCAACAAWRCRCSRARSNVRSTWRRRWTAAATAGAATSPRRPPARGQAATSARRAGDRRSACSACSTAARPSVLGIPMLALGAVLLGGEPARCASVGAIRVALPARPVAHAGVVDGRRGRRRAGRARASPVTSASAGCIPTYSPLDVPPLPVAARRSASSRAALPAFADTAAAGRASHDPLRRTSRSRIPTPTAPALVDVDFDGRRRRVLPRRRRDRRGQVDVAARGERARPALHRRHAARAGDRRRHAPRSRRPASWPIGSASSARTRPRASSPTPSRTSSRTRWRTSASRPT